MSGIRPVASDGWYEARNLPRQREHGQPRVIAQASAQSVGYSTNGNNDTADLFASSGSNALFTDLAMAQLYGDMIRRGGANQAWIALDSPLVRSRMGEGCGFANPRKPEANLETSPADRARLRTPLGEAKLLRRTP